MNEKYESECPTYSIDYLGKDNKHRQNAENYYAQAILKAYKLNDVTGALDDFDKSILFGSSSENELHPQYANTYYHRAVLKQIKLDDVPGALSDYDRAIELNPQFVDAYYNRGILKQTKL
jgi:tetratricopeptide (TPR) repeat protein